MSAPYFSVITPSYRQGAFIGRCIESVASQGDPSFEHLVLDNLSDDETPQVVARFPHVRFLSEPDRGQSHAINKGFLAARGEIICWLNSDDFYPPGLFARLREIFANPSVQVVFGDVEQCDAIGLPGVRVPARWERREDLVRWWSREVRLHQPAIFFRRSVREATGLLNESLHYAMDYEYWWRMSAAFPFLYIPEVLAVQIRQPDSKTIRAWRRVYAEREKIFCPHYHLIDGGNRRRLLLEKRRAMSRRYLGDAFAAAARDPREALALLTISLLEWPPTLANPQWLGVIRRVIFR